DSTSSCQFSSDGIFGKDKVFLEIIQDARCRIRSIVALRIYQPRCLLLAQSGHWTWVQLDLIPRILESVFPISVEPDCCAETLSHGEKRQVEKKPAPSAPRGPRATSRGLGYLLASEPKWPDVSDRGRRPGSEDRLVFPVAQRWGPN